MAAQDIPTKTLSNNGITTGEIIEALQVSQSIDAFTGADAYAITISGSLEITGSLVTTGSMYFQNLVDVPATASNELGAVMIDSEGRLYSGSSSVGSQGTDGAKVIVCRLKNNPMGYTSVAYPTDELKLPQWFKDLPFDEDGMEEAVLDKKLHNVLGAMNFDLDRMNESETLQAFFEF